MTSHGRHPRNSRVPVTGCIRKIRSWRFVGTLAKLVAAKLPRLITSYVRFRVPRLVSEI
jgi:hypothetical protein